MKACHFETSTGLLHGRDQLLAAEDARSSELQDRDNKDVCASHHDECGGGGGGGACLL